MTGHGTLPPDDGALQEVVIETEAPFTVHEVSLAMTSKADIVSTPLLGAGWRLCDDLEIIDSITSENFNSDYSQWFSR